MDLLDRLGPKRFDVEEIVEAANRYDELPETEQAEYLSLSDYAGLLEAEHPLTSLLRESHNATCVVRDIDGPLMMLWEEPLSGVWDFGPLCRQNLISDEEL